MPSFSYGTTNITYKLIRTNRIANISIAVEWQNGITVKAPEHYQEQTIKDVLYKKAPWILQKWHAINDIVDPPLPKEYVSGEKFAYLGRHYKLKVIKSSTVKKSSITLYRGRFIASVPVGLSPQQQCEELYTSFKSWYISHGEAKIKERLELYAPMMGVSPSKVRLKEQKMRWGTCTKEGAIYLNWRIVMAPMTVIDYLLVHELAHIRYPDHSNYFWRLIQSILPDYEQRKEWLRVNGPRLTIE